MNPDITSGLYPKTYRTPGWLAVFFTTFGVVMVAIGVTLLWMLYVPDFEGRAAMHIGLAGAAVGIFILAGIAIGTLMIFTSKGGTEFVLYDDAIEQVSRLGKRRLQKDEIAYKMALNYPVPYVVLIPRDKKRKKISIVPCTLVQEDGLKAWLDLIPGQQDWLNARRAGRGSNATGTGTPAS